MYYLKLIRPLNLFLIILTQLLFWFAIVLPNKIGYFLSPQLESWQFALLVLSTVTIAAGGYVINDYEDLPIDLENRADHVIVSKYISEGKVFSYYVLLTATGLVSALVLCFSIGRLSLFAIHFIIVGLLWFYAHAYKKMFLVGNILVSIATAMVIAIICFYEIIPSEIINQKDRSSAFFISRFGLIYSGFAFFVTLIREIVKDIEDRKGDAMFDVRSLPIKLGLEPSKAVVFVLLGVLLSALLALLRRLVIVGNVFPIIYIIVLLIIPNIYAFWLTYKIQESKDARKLGNVLKFIMFTGVMSMAYILYTFKI